jgi:hypothetical protein
MNTQALSVTSKIKNSTLSGIMGRSVPGIKPSRALNYNQRMNFLSYSINVTLYGPVHYLTSIYGHNR